MKCEWCGKPTDALGTCTGVCDDPADYRRDDHDDRYGDPGADDELDRAVDAYERWIGRT